MTEEEEYDKFIASKLIDGSWYWIQLDDGSGYECRQWNANSMGFYKGVNYFDTPLSVLSEPPRGPITADALPVVGDDSVAGPEFIHSLPGAQRQGHEDIYRFGDVELDVMWNDGNGGPMIKIDVLKCKRLTEEQVKQLLSLLGVGLPS